jgi:nucleoside-diphosphate-sugar epimerase
MKHLIIGNSGFVGKHLEQYLAAKYKKKKCVWVCFTIFKFNKKRKL